MSYEVPNNDGLTRDTQLLKNNYVKYRTLLHFIYINKEFYRISDEKVSAINERVVKKCGKVVHTAAGVTYSNVGWIKTWSEVSRDSIFVHQVKKMLSVPDIIKFLNEIIPCGITCYLGVISEFGECLERCQRIGMMQNIPTHAKNDSETLNSWIKSLKKEGPDSFVIPHKVYELAQKYNEGNSVDFATSLDKIILHTRGNHFLRPYVWATILDNIYGTGIELPEYKPHEILKSATMRVEVGVNQSETRDFTFNKLNESISVQEESNDQMMGSSQSGSNHFWKKNFQKTSTSRMSSYELPNTDGTTKLTRNFKCNYLKYRTLLHSIYIYKDQFSVSDESVSADNDAVLRECGKIYHAAANVQFKYTVWKGIWSDISNDKIFVAQVKKMMDVPDIVEFLSKIVPCGIERSLIGVVQFGKSLERCLRELSKEKEVNGLPNKIRVQFEAFEEWKLNLKKEGPNTFLIPDAVYKLAQKYEVQDSPNFATTLNDMISLVKVNSSVLRPLVWAMIIKIVFNAEINLPEYEPHRSVRCVLEDKSRGSSDQNSINEKTGTGSYAVDQQKTEKKSTRNEQHAKQMNIERIVEHQGGKVEDDKSMFAQASLESLPVITIPLIPGLKIKDFRIGLFEVPMFSKTCCSCGLPDSKTVNTLSDDSTTAYETADECTSSTNAQNSKRTNSDHENEKKTNKRARYSRRIKTSSRQKKDNAYADN